MMRDEDIHIGDILRIRQWDDLVDEFGLDEDGEINFRVGTAYASISLWFDSKQRYLCGQTFTVDKIDPGYACCFYHSKENIERRGYACSYIIIADMLEPYKEAEFEIATDEEIKALFDMQV